MTASMFDFENKQLAGAGAPSSGIGNYVGPSGDIITTADRNQALKLARMGYTASKGADLEKAEVAQSFNHWYDKAAEGVANFVGGMPGVTAAINAVLPADMAGNFNEAQKVGQDIDPGLATAAQLSGGLVAGAIGGNLVNQAGTALGVLGQSGSIPGIGSLAGSAFETDYLPAQMVSGGVQNAMMGLGYKIDAAALQHALTPEGQDKIFDHVGYDTMLDFAIGAAVPLADKGIGKAFKAAGGALQEWGQDNMMQAMFGRDNMQAVVSRARQSELGQWLEANELWKGTPSQISKRAWNIKAAAENAMNDVKEAVGDFKLGDDLHKELAETLNNTLGEGKYNWAKDTDVAGGPLLRRIAQLDKPIGLQELQNLRQKLGNAIDWSAGLGDQKNMSRMAAYNAINQTVDGFLEQRAGAAAGSMETLNQWKLANHNYSNAVLVTSNIAKGPKSVSWFEKSLNGALGYGGTAAAFTGHGAAAAVAGTVKAAQKLHAMYNDGKLGYVANALGRVFKDTSDRLAEAVEHGYYGLGPWAKGEAPATHDNYDIKSAQVRFSAGNPQETMSNVSEALSKAGYPQPFVDPMLRRKMAIDQHLAIALPKSPYVGSPTPMQWRPDDHAKQQWLELYNTAHDPTHWIANPSNANSMIAEIAYPDLVKRTRDIVMEHIANHQDAPMESRIWASRILQAPVEPMLNAGTALVYMKALQVGAGQPVQVPPSPNPAGKLDQDMISSDSTKLEQLQGK